MGWYRRKQNDQTIGCGVSLTLPVPLHRKRGREINKFKKVGKGGHNYRPPLHPPHLTLIMTGANTSTIVADTAISNAFVSPLKKKKKKKKNYFH